MCPLLCSLALHLGGESGEREHDLLGGRVERALPVVEVVEEPNAGVQDLLDDVGGLDLLSPEPTLFTHDQDLKWRGWPKRVQEPRQPRSEVPACPARWMTPYRPSVIPRRHSPSGRESIHSLSRRRPFRPGRDASCFRYVLIAPKDTRMSRPRWIASSRPFQIAR